MLDNMKKVFNFSIKEVKDFRTKIYCFDLDKTLCTAEENYADAKPLKDRILKVNKLYKKGYTILIDTARGSKTGIDYQKMTEEQLKEWGVKYHKLRTGVKMFANYYIDDKGISDKQFFHD